MEGVHEITGCVSEPYYTISRCRSGEPEAALGVGVPLESLLIVEWEFGG